MKTTCLLVKMCIIPIQSDLVHTIGESAALGVSGVVLWGSSEYARSQVMKKEIQQTKNITGGLETIKITQTCDLTNFTYRYY